MKAWAILYTAVVQMVLMYWYENWVVIDTIVTVLEDFHHREDQILTGLTEIRGNTGEREWPPVSTAL